jgi:cytochrome c biogenesis protein CcdA
MFLATVYFFQQEFALMFAYLTAGMSWIVVASYEYKERIFDRAIAALVAKYGEKQEDDEQ